MARTPIDDCGHLTERLATALTKKERRLIELEVAAGEHDSTSAGIRYYVRRGLRAAGIDHRELAEVD